MSVGPFKLRSSWPSSFVTGLIGWNGFFIIVALVLGEQRAAGKLFLLASIAAIAQVAFLRVLFFGLRLDRSTAAAAFWGAFTGVAAVIVEIQLMDVLGKHPLIWELNGMYIGLAVGLEHSGQR